ncbi:Glycine-rich RNA-binding protein GRP1A [Labilithrix luteola]|uniref:Glycine-rich RNA-binding protein GRP1A n=2 Tax=Labilithrix luteola TaxID=1391654 RepID=A0A0K1PQB3_9BACT|nr:Glycine-rich RNA-binding protein GRP1A [Labilithrix luteola]
MVGCSSDDTDGVEAQASAETDASLFEIGGTVTGLEGSGLVLKNNGADDLAVDSGGGSSTFKFKTKVAAGTKYDVTVATNPEKPSQSCTVAGGSGTVVAGGVSTVVVNCSTNRFTVGGTVSGLDGTGLVLQNNKGDDATINANGTFSFATPIVSGAAFRVTVATQPSDQFCVVDDGDGVMSAAPVSNVTVSCVKSSFSNTGTGATGTLQSFTAPQTRTYRIEAWGAQGASGGAVKLGGLGARMRGDFALTKGDVLTILVGQAGTQTTDDGGGGGGSFVVIGTTPLLVAGGGGGTRVESSFNGRDASVGPEGVAGSGENDGPENITAGGTAGSGGGFQDSWGAGGGGFSGDGADDTDGDSVYGYGGKSFLQGGEGGGSGTGCDGAPAFGGFGGGGAGNGCNGGGGGGGYSGGGGGWNAGGGGSFNSGLNPSNSAGARSGHGLVTITLAP